MTIEADIADRYEAWGKAIVERDAASLRQLFDPSYVYTSDEGARIPRDRMIEIECVLPPPQVLSPPVDVQHVTDDVVICRGIDELEGEVPDGFVSPAHQRGISGGLRVAFTTVWRHDGTTWRVVSNDAHQIPPGGAEGEGIDE